MGNKHHAAGIHCPSHLWDYGTAILDQCVAETTSASTDTDSGVPALDTITTVVKEMVDAA